MVMRSAGEGESACAAYVNSVSLYPTLWFIYERMFYIQLSLSDVNKLVIVSFVES